ncbi:MAG: carbamoyltransferase [Gammaproteobacteria bacterium]|nr:carbamoyltransferase [Gammaproteobacteria bacterium]
MIVLGLSGALGHDPSAALLVDGEIVAAAEEERFVGDKHARGRMAVEAARYCLREAGLDASAVQAVAFPYAPVSAFDRGRWHYARRHWYAPDRALDAIFNGNRRFRRNRRRAMAAGEEIGIDWSCTRFLPVRHHLAHAASAYHLAGFDGDAAILGVDGKGEYATTFVGVGEGARIRTIKEFHDPDSLAGAYGALTQYLGFEMLDGEFRVMGMAPYGDASWVDFRPMLGCRDGKVMVDTRLLNTVGWRRHRHRGKGRYFGKELVRQLGPVREGDAADEPYVHYAAAMQTAYEEAVLHLIDHYLAETLARTRRLAFAGGGALNVKLNQRILARADVDELFVQPAAGDSGTSLGAAVFVAIASGDNVRPMQHAYLGPSFTTADCLAALAGTSFTVERLENPGWRAAELVAEGHPVAWFQGRMEFGPRALGARSILAAPSTTGIADRINAEVKFRERWRPFCPSLTAAIAPEVLGSAHPAPYMTITFDIAEGWRKRIGQVVHEDGTARPQVVDRDTNPRYHALLERLGTLTSTPVVLNTSLNLRGEPIACTPADAVSLFSRSGLQYMVMEDVLVSKRSA